MYDTFLSPTPLILRVIIITLAIFLLDSNRVNTGQVWYMSGCLMVRFSNGGLKTQQKMYVLWSNMSGIQMVSEVSEK